LRSSCIRSTRSSQCYPKSSASARPSRLDALQLTSTYRCHMEPGKTTFQSTADRLCILSHQTDSTFAVAYCTTPQTINRVIKTREGEKRKKTGIPAEDSSHNRGSFRIEHMRDPAGAASDIHIGRSPVRNPGNTHIDSGLGAGPKQAAPTKNKTGYSTRPTNSLLSTHNILKKIRRKISQDFNLHRLSACCQGSCPMTDALPAFQSQSGGAFAELPLHTL